MISGEIIDILKCSDPCPFLQSDYSCSVIEIKPIMCLIYPIIFEPDKGKKWKIELDKLCPLAQNLITAEYFETYGDNLIEKLKISHKWIERIYKIDDFDYNYKAMISNRNIPIEEYKIYELDELLRYKI